MFKNEEMSKTIVNCKFYPLFIDLLQVITWHQDPLTYAMFVYKLTADSLYVLQCPFAKFLVSVSFRKLKAGTVGKAAI